MPHVKQVTVARLALGLTVDPALYVSEARARKVFEALSDGFPQLVTVPVIEDGRMAMFLRPARGDGQVAPVCQLLGTSVVVGIDEPTPDEIEGFPTFARRLYELVREVFHVGRVARAGRVESTLYALEGGGEAAAEALRDGLTNLTADDAQDVQLKFTRRDGLYNINLNLSTVPSEAPGDPTAWLRDAVLAQSDVNNWDQTGDVTWEQSEAIWRRGVEHSEQEVRAFLRGRLRLDIE